MAIEYVKKATKTPESGADDTRRIVTEMLAEILSGGEGRVRDYARELDGWHGEIAVTRKQMVAVNWICARSRFRK